MSVQRNQDPSIYQITLLRHAQSVGNLKKYHQGQVDYPLTELGEKQAKALAERWQQEQKFFDLAITSTLARASHTADIITSQLGISLESDPIWMERDNGGLGGLLMSDAEKRYPRSFMHPYKMVGNSGESQWELYLRAGRAVQSLINRPPGHYLIISHGAILNMVLYAILGIVPQANFYGPRFRFRNTAFADLSYRPDTHSWVLLSLNDLLHWEDNKEKSA